MTLINPAAHRMPDAVPVLSRGKHRNPRKGACFMEMASFLAGERWSDHPSCTHPLLAALARSVNDHVSDQARERIVPLIPDVIGLRPSDPRVAPELALAAAHAALPVAPMTRQRVAAVGLIRATQVLNRLEGRPEDELSDDVERALDEVPDARDWARRFTLIGEGRRGTFARRGAPAIVHSSVVGISQSTARDVDGLLVDLLVRAIDICCARQTSAQTSTQTPAQAASAESSVSSTAGSGLLPTR